MIQLEVVYSPGMAAIGVVVSASAMMVAYGRQIIEDRFSENAPVSTVTSTNVCHFLMGKGYIVLDVFAKSAIKWEAVITENGKDKKVEITTDGTTIQAMNIL